MAGKGGGGGGCKAGGGWAQYRFSNEQSAFDGLTLEFAAAGHNISGGTSFYTQ